MKKIVIVGPVYPYKGGISHYTGLMARNLRKEYEVEMISYKMQYPKFMFKKEQRDYDNDTFKVEDTKYLIHTANPFNIASVSKKIRNMNPDLVIVQWWHPYFAPCYTILRMGLKKIPVIYVCHNVFPHERFPLDRFLTKLVLKKGNGFILHSNKEVEDLKTIIDNPKHIVAKHPTYNAFKFNNYTKSDAKSIINESEDKKILLFFGLVREYKGLKHLLRAMPDIIQYDSNIVLYVVGDFGSNKEDYLSIINENKIADNVRIVDGYVPDKEVEKYFAASDIVVLPYESATQSGVVQIAYGFDKPCLVTKVGGLPDVVIDGKTGYVVEPFNPRAISNAVINFYKENKEQEFISGVQSEAYKYDWDRMNEAIQTLYNDINDRT